MAYQDSQNSLNRFKKLFGPAAQSIYARPHTQPGVRPQGVGPRARGGFGGWFDEISAMGPEAYFSALFRPGNAPQRTPFPPGGSAQSDYAMHGLSDEARASTPAAMVPQQQPSAPADDFGLLAPRKQSPVMAAPKMQPHTLEKMSKVLSGLGGLAKNLIPPAGDETDLPMDRKAVINAFRQMVGGIVPAQGGAAAGSPAAAPPAAAPPAATQLGPGGFPVPTRQFGTGPAMPEGFGQPQPFQPPQAAAQEGQVPQWKTAADALFAQDRLAQQPTAATAQTPAGQAAFAHNAAFARLLPRSVQAQMGLQPPMASDEAVLALQRQNDMRDSAGYATSQMLPGGAIQRLDPSRPKLWGGGGALGEAPRDQFGGQISQAQAQNNARAEEMLASVDYGNRFRPGTSLTPEALAENASNRLSRRERLGLPVTREDRLAESKSRRQLLQDKRMGISRQERMVMDAMKGEGQGGESSIMRDTLIGGKEYAAARSQERVAKLQAENETLRIASQTASAKERVAMEKEVAANDVEIRKATIASNTTLGQAEITSRENVNLAGVKAESEKTRIGILQMEHDDPNVTPQRKREIRREMRGADSAPVNGGDAPGAPDGWSGVTPGDLDEIEVGAESAQDFYAQARAAGTPHDVAVQQAGIRYGDESTLSQLSRNAFDFAPGLMQRYMKKPEMSRAELWELEYKASLGDPSAVAQLQEYRQSRKRENLGDVGRAAGWPVSLFLPRR